MFINGVEVINSRLENITLDHPKQSEYEMHPSSDSASPAKSKLPLLHLTPSGSNDKKDGTSTPQRIDNPWLLRVQDSIPNTPPPKTEKPNNFFPHRIG